MTKFLLTKSGEKSWRLIFFEEDGSSIRDIHESEDSEGLLRTFVKEMLPKEFIEAVNVQRRSMRQKLL